jgi:hypothetical protein
VQRLAQSALPIALSLGIACGSAKTPTDILVDEGEPQLEASSTIVFQDDFESYDGTCLSMDMQGPWNTSSGTCDSNPNGVISSPNGTGYAGDVNGVGGRSARWIWPISTTEQFYPIEAVIGGQTGATEYYTYWYKAPNFIYRAAYPRVGKKMFILFVGDGSVGRVTINPSAFSIQPSNAAKVDSEFDHWPAGITTEDAFLTWLTDGQWHRYTILRKPESRDGAGDGALLMWVDGYLVIDRQNFGTYSARTSSILLAGTFNGGSSKVQTEYYDHIVVWR